MQYYNDACCCCFSHRKYCLTLSNAMNCGLPGSSVHGILQARILEWVAISFPGDLPDPGIEPTSPALAGRFFTTEPAGRPHNDAYMSLYKKSIKCTTQRNPYVNYRPVDNDVDNATQ